MAPTDQRAGVRPISFLLDNGGSISAPVHLKIRPEDLNRTEPSRATVHQTLGITAAGWVDNFGEGLGSVTISGHTGWRSNGYFGEDGVTAFERLNQLVAHDYHRAKQAAINSGRDPATVKLLFVDTLDGFAWSVLPQVFQLRRNRSRPLLMQYNMTLQQIGGVDDGFSIFFPNFGGIGAGLSALSGAVSALSGFASNVAGWVGTAMGYVDRALAPIGAVARQFLNSTTSIFGSVITAVSAIKNGAFGTANRLIGIARDLAQSGSNIFRSIAAIAGLPSALKASLSRVAAAYNEVWCIFNNSLRPRKVYDNYSGLYGASNCSSTTGGRSASSYASTNVFAAMQPDRVGPYLSSAAISSIGSINRADMVLAPLPMPEVARHLTNIAAGVTP